MSEHYFSQSPESHHDQREFSLSLRGMSLTFQTDAGVFSKTNLDRGTRLLIDTMELPETGNILDLGCGYGPLGIVAARLCPAARVYMVDVNQRAVVLAQANIDKNEASNASAVQGPGFAPVPGLRFSAILSNPPIRAGKRVIYPLVEEAAQHLEPGGMFWTVIRTQQGAKSLRRHMETVFDCVEERAKGGGFRVYTGTAGSSTG